MTDERALDAAIETVRNRNIATLELAIKVGVEAYLSTLRAHPAPATVEMRELRDLEDAILACERGTMSDVLANYRTVRRTIQDTRAALAPATETKGRPDAGP